MNYVDPTGHRAVIMNDGCTGSSCDDPGYTSDMSTWTQDMQDAYEESEQTVSLQGAQALMDAGVQVSNTSSLGGSGSGVT